MSAWLQNRLKAAEELLHAVDRTAKNVSEGQAQGSVTDADLPQAQAARLSFANKGRTTESPPPTTQPTSKRNLSGSTTVELQTSEHRRNHNDEVESEAGATTYQRKSSAIPFGLVPRANSQQHTSAGVPMQPVGGLDASKVAAHQATKEDEVELNGSVSESEHWPQRSEGEPGSAVGDGRGQRSETGNVDTISDSDAAGPTKLAAQSTAAAALKGIAGAEAAAEGAAEMVLPPPSVAAKPASGAPANSASDGSAAANDALPPPAGSVATAAAVVEAAIRAAAAAGAARDAANGEPSGSVDKEGPAAAAEPHSAHHHPGGADGLHAEDASAARNSSRTSRPDPGAADESSAPGVMTQREVRLQKMAERLKQRLEQYKLENEQLEEMLRIADAKAQGGTGEIERLEDEVARAQAARISAEAALEQALSKKEAELLAVKTQMEVLQSKLSKAEELLEQMQDANNALIQERKASESHLIQSLREEVEGIERVLEEERAAHAASRKSFATREHDLEASLQDSASSLTRMQRDVEDRSARLAAVEERCHALEQEVDSLSHQLRAADARLQKQAELLQQSSSEALQLRVAELEGQVLQEQAATSTAERGRAAADEELVQLRSEVGGLKRQLAEAVSQDAVDLQRRLKEVTDLLYLKQTQLERIASEKAAQQLQLERELAQARSEAEQVKRRARADRVIAAAEDAVVPMDTLGDAYYRLANNNRVGGAVKAGAKLLDATASQAVRILKQYPVGRLVVFAYILGVHLFIYLLINRLQRRALSADVAGSIPQDPTLDSLHEQLAG